MSPVERRILADVPVSDWDRLAGDGFLASRGFLDLWRTMGGRPVTWVVEDAGHAAAMLPGVEYGFGPWRRFAALPDGCYGGVRVDPALACEERRFARALLDAIVRHGYAKACVFDFHRRLTPGRGYEEHVEATRWIDIGDPEWRPADPKLRSQIRKAMREGIVIEPFDWDRHAAGFMALVTANARRRGQRPRHPAAFYRALAHLAAGDRRIRWYHCERDGRPVASHIYFATDNTLQAWQSYFDRAFSFLKPNPYIREAACREAVRAGVRWLNLGATPVGATGLAYYKSRWGGSELRYSSWYRWHGFGSVARIRYGSVPKPPVPRSRSARLGVPLWTSPTRPNE